MDNWQNSEVMEEFIRLASENETFAVKIASTKTADDKKTIEEKRLPEPEKSIIEIAHPKPVYVAESMGDGGLVENQIEQHKKLEEILNKMPTGSLTHRHASIVKSLVKIAEICDDNQEYEAADLITSAADTIAKTLPLE